MSQIHVANRRKIIINPDIINIVNVKKMFGFIISLFIANESNSRC